MHIHYNHLFLYKIGNNILVMTTTVASLGSGFIIPHADFHLIFTSMFTFALVLLINKYELAPQQGKNL
jgi:hypothetical protein